MVPQDMLPMGISSAKLRELRYAAMESHLVVYRDASIVHVKVKIIVLHTYRFWIEGVKVGSSLK